MCLPSLPNHTKVYASPSYKRFNPERGKNMHFYFDVFLSLLNSFSVTLPYIFLAFISKIIQERIRKLFLIFSFGYPVSTCQKTNTNYFCRNMAGNFSYSSRYYFIAFYNRWGTKLPRLQYIKYLLRYVV